VSAVAKAHETARRLARLGWSALDIEGAIIRDLRHASGMSRGQYVQKARQIAQAAVRGKDRR
jgi:hypothetical protein